MKQQILDIIERHATPFLDDKSLHQDKWNIVAEEIVELIGQNRSLSVIEQCKDYVGQMQDSWIKLQILSEVANKKKESEQEYLEMFNRIKGNYFDRAAKRFVPTRKISKPSALHNALKQYSMEDLGKVMIGAFKDEHHMKSGWCYVTTEFVLRPHVIERYLNK